ncbi:MAG TPA: DMT family transporter [Victivallales bacterium]|nr:DMT family transporter [Victivallales bacterium]
MNNTGKGVCFALLSGLSIAVMGVFVKLTDGQLSNFTLLFFRFLISLLILLPLVKKEANFSFKIKFPVILSVRCVFGFIALACYFIAIQYIPLANAVLLENTFPVFVPIILFIATGMKTDKKVLGGIFLSFIGIIIILNPGRNILQSASFIGLIGGICAAVSFVCLRLMLAKDSSQFSNILLWFFFFCTILSGILMIFDFSMPDLIQFLFLILIGVFGYFFQFLMTKALQYACVRIVSPMMYFSVLFAGCFDFVIWGITPHMYTLIGVVITVLGAIYVILHRKTLD